MQVKTFEARVLAYKVARAEVVLSSLKEKAKLDPSQLKAKLTSIQGQLETLQAVKSSMTGYCIF
jgi:predicted component of type VI protein secretion system